MAALLVTERWPELDYAAWKDTRDTLHLWIRSSVKFVWR